MNELTDLELCKKIAEIEGLAVADPGVVSSREYNESTCLIIPHGKHSPYSYVYSPLTNKALLFDLMVKYKVELNHNQEDSNLAVIWPSDIETSNLIGNYFVEFKCDADIPRAILECIVEANSGKAN